MVVVLKQVLFFIILQLALTSTVISPDPDDNVIDQDGGASDDDDDRTVVDEEDVATALDDLDYGAHVDSDQDDDNDFYVGRLNEAVDMLPEGYIYNRNTGMAIRDDRYNAADNSEETSDKAVYGDTITPDPLYDGVTFNDNLIALVPDDVWITKEIQDAKCSAKIRVYCSSGILGAQDECIPQTGSNAVFVTVTIVGSTDTDGPPLKYPNGNPPIYVLHEDAFYKIARGTAGMINMFYFRVQSTTAEQGLEAGTSTIA